MKRLVVLLVVLSFLLCGLQQVFSSGPEETTRDDALPWPVRASVRTINGHTYLFINDEKTIPLAFYSYPQYVFFRSLNKTLSQVSLSKEAGNHLYIILLDYLDDSIFESILQLDEEAYFIIRLGVSSEGLSESDLFQYMDRDGRIISEGSDIELRKSGAVASSTWLEQAKSTLSEQLDHFRSSSYAHRIIGIQLCYMQTGEWFLSPNQEAFPEYSEAALKVFREWLEMRYDSNVKKLQEAWKDPNVAFSTAAIPTRLERLDNADGFLRDLSRGVQRQIVDYLEFYNESIAIAISELAKFVKEKTDNSLLVAAMYGYVFEFSRWKYPVNSGHYGLDVLLESEYIDFLGAPLSYVDRQSTGVGPFMSVIDSLAKNGKMWLSESDIRTYLTAPEAGYGRAATLEETRGVLWRNFGHYLVRGIADYWMDLVGFGWFEDRDLWRDMIKMRNIYASEYLGDNAKGFSPDVAVIVSTLGMLVQQTPRGIAWELLGENLQALAKSGVSYGLYSLKDLAKLEDARVFVFLNCFQISDEEREVIKSLQKDDKVFIWMYGSGVVTDDGLDLTSMKDLTGMEMMKLDSSTEMKTEVTDGNHVLTKFMDSEVFGRDTRVRPAFAVNDENVTELGKYAGSSHTSLALREMDSWYSVFLGSASLEPGLLRGAVALGGGHNFISSNRGEDTYSIGRGFMMIHGGANPEQQTVKLADKALVVELVEGKIVGENIDGFNVTMQPGETNIYTFLSGIKEISVINILERSVMEGDWAVDGKSLSSDEAGAKIEFDFTGTSLLVKFGIRSSGGRVDVTIDGVKYPFVDLYASHEGDRVVLIAKDLVDKAHTVILEVREDADVDSQGRWVDIMSVFAQDV